MPCSLEENQSLPEPLVWRCCPDSKDKGLTCELGKMWRERSFPVEGPLGRRHGGGTV